MEILKKMLLEIGIPIKGSYTGGEVCRILGISRRTFWSLVRDFEPMGGASVGLDSFMLRNHRRVPINVLADFISANRSYDRVYGFIEDGINES